MILRFSSEEAEALRITTVFERLIASTGIFTSIKPKRCPVNAAPRQMLRPLTSISTKGCSS